MSFLFLLSPVILGYLTVCWILPRQGRDRSITSVKVFLAIGVGFGLTSFIAYVLLVLGIFTRMPLLMTELGLTLIFGMLALRQSYVKDVPLVGDHERPNAVSSVKVRGRILTIFSVALAVAVGIFTTFSQQSPHGGGDAWAIWNLRARFLFRGTEHWTDAFSSAMFWSHPDYPLLLPASVARGWLITGTETVLVPILLAASFTFGMLGLIVSALASLQGVNQGLLAAAVLLASSFVANGATQTADVPLAFYFLSFVIVTVLREKFRPARIFLLLGVLAGLSAWVKNEGCLFLLIAATIAGFTLFGQAGVSKVKLMGYFCGGILPSVLVLLHFKTQIAPTNDLFEGQTSDMILSRLMSIDRYWLVLKASGKIVAKFAAWPANIPVALLLYFYLVRARPGVWCRREISLSVVLLSVMLSGYYCVFVITPYDIGWHVSNSLERLLLQIWPSALFLYFCIVRAPK
jgi:hypothetical protein